MGRITLETFPDNDTTCYSYNNAGWLKFVGTWVNPNCIPSGGYVNDIAYNARGQKLSLQYANNLTTTWDYFPNNFRLQSRQTLAGGTHTTVALARWAKSWTTQDPLPPPSGFANLYAAGICIRDGAGTCIGGDSTVEALGGSVLGYIKTSSGAGTVPVYQSTRYVDSGGSAIGWGLSLTADGPVAGHLSTTAPDSQSALMPFIQSNGLLLQGLTGTASAYLWSVQTGTVNHTDHYYLTVGQPPSGYISEGVTAYIDGVSSSGTVALVRYTNSTTAHNYYSTANDPPSGFGGGTTVGHLHGTSGSGLVGLYRHYNSTTGDYLITTSATPPGGYVMQALLGYGHSSGVSSTQQNLAYTYDPVGNVATITDAVWTGSRSFQYDDLNRMTQAGGTFGTNQAMVTQDYTYDAIGNILSKAGVSYCYGYMAGCTDTNRPSGVKTTSDGASYAYDANGNIASGGGRSYTWNSDNRLDQVTGPGGSAVMTYDYTGIRIKKSGSSGTTYFPFTGYEDQGGTITKYIRLGNEIIASKQGASTKRFYHNDHLGGVNIISDLNGNQVQLNEYDPWGKVSRSEGNVDPTHRFTGQELDSESDIHYYGGRYYHQALGRFISPDPFVQDPNDPQNVNRYSYVLNSPQNYIDPSGYFWIDSDYGCCEITLSKTSFEAGYSSNLWNSIQSTYNQISSFGSSSFWSGAGVSSTTNSSNGGFFGELPSFDRVLSTASNISAGAGDFFSGGFMNIGGFNERVFGHRAISISEFARQTSPIEGTDRIVDQNSLGYAVGKNAALSVSVASFWSAGLYAGGNSAIYSPLSAASGAQAAGRTVIENTPIGGLMLHLQKTYNIVPRWLWYGASGTYVLNASGRVPAFINGAGGEIVKFEMWLLRLRNVPIDPVK